MLLGMLQQERGIPTEDTTTLNVIWHNFERGAEGGEPTSQGVGVYTASWVAPKSDVHSRQGRRTAPKSDVNKQRFFYLGHRGEVRVDQATQLQATPATSPRATPSS